MTVRSCGDLQKLRLLGFVPRSVPYLQVSPCLLPPPLCSSCVYCLLLCLRSPQLICSIGYALVSLESTLLNVIVSDLSEHHLEYDQAIRKWQPRCPERGRMTLKMSASIMAHRSLPLPPPAHALPTHPTTTLVHSETLFSRAGPPKPSAHSCAR